MYKNQLQELAQRSCFNLPSYTSIREGPDHAPRFKAVVNFNGESFESPSYCSTLRQAEHSAAEVALNALAGRGPSNSLAARILDETGVYKNLLQEVSQRVGASLPAYTTFRTGLGHLPVFTCTVELAGVIFTGEPAKNKKQAEKNAAMAAWLSLKSLVQQTETPYEKTHKDEQEHVTVARALQKYLIKARLARLSFPIKFPTLNPRPTTSQQSPATSSRILPLICPKTSHRHRHVTPAANNNLTFQKIIKTNQPQPSFTVPNEANSSKKSFPAAGAPPYIPVRHCSIAPPVTMRNSIPVFSAPPPPQPSLMMRHQPPLGMAPPVSVRQAVPVFAAPVLMDPPIKTDEPPVSISVTGKIEPFGVKPFPVAAVPNPAVSTVQVDPPSSEVLTTRVESPSVPKVGTPSPESSKASAEDAKSTVQEQVQETAAVEEMKDLKI